MVDMEDARSKAQFKKTLMEQAKALELEVDGRWSIETLAEKVAEAQIEAEANAAQKVRDDSDTWVYLNRGAWPTSEQKHMAGEVICIPQDMAERWVASGAARPAMKSEIPQ